MVRFKREELLLHPLCRKLLDYKWSSLGRPMHYLNFFTYLVFLLTFTTYVIILREEALMWSSFNAEDFISTNFSTLPPSCQNKYIHLYASHANGTAELHSQETYREMFQQGYAFILYGFMCFQILKELFQMISRRLKYFKELSNWIEFLLYSNCATFTMPMIVPKLGKCELLVWDFYWIFGIISLFLAWINLCLYLRKSGQIGIYVVMIQDVFMTLIRVILMFTVVMIAFGLVFYLLLKEQASFNSLELTMLKVLVMTIGEMDYSDVFINSESEINTETGAPKLPLSWLARIFFLVFCFVMPIIFMNLLIGLAVGDIDTIQKTAHLEKRKMQVDFVADIEDKYPKIVIRQFYKDKLVHYPNKVKKNRFLNLFAAKELKFKGHENEDLEHAQTHKDTRLEIRFEKDLKKLKQKMKGIQETLKDIQIDAGTIVEAMDLRVKKKRRKSRQTVSEEELMAIHSRSERQKRH